LLHSRGICKEKEGMLKVQSGLSIATVEAISEGVTYCCILVEFGKRRKKDFVDVNGRNSAA